MKAKVIYIVNFPVEGNSGKNKATREKARVLHNLIGKENFCFFYSKKSTSIWSKVFNMLFFDILVACKIFKLERNSIAIQRVSFMPLSRLAQFLKKMTVITEFHADLKDEIPHLNKSRFEKVVLRCLVPRFNLTYRLSHGIIYNHPILKERFDEKYNKPSIYSYNGANFNEFYPEDKELARKKLKLNKDEVIFLFLGSVSKWHGVDYLIDLFNEEKLKSEKNVYLYIVGAKDNNYSRRLKESSENSNVIFVSPVDTDKARGYINASDYCMLPAKQIRISPGSPLKLYDYIACGKPIIAQSNLRGYSDEVEKYKLGYTVDFRDSKKSGLEVLKLLSNNKDFSKNNRDVAVNKVSWENRMLDWIAFMEKLYYENKNT